jgi:hypothetical protein
MPITAWKCPSCHSNVALDHFATSGCGFTIHPDYAAAVLRTQEIQHPNGKVRVSSASGCPRAGAIMAAEPIAADPLSFNSMTTGTAWHRLMAEGADPTTTEIEVSGIIEGIAMVGHIDRILTFNDKLVICDWKHANDFSRKYLKDSAKPEHIVQTSLYAELYAQQHGPRPARGVNWYHFTSSPPFVPMWYDLWPLSRALEHKPYGCGFTVLELLRQAESFATGAVRWQNLPLVGEGFQFSGKNACDYCGVYDACKTQSSGAPF